MSSLSSGISVTPELERFLSESRTGQHNEVAVLRVLIRGDNLIEAGRKNGSPNGDLSQLIDQLNDFPAFYLLRASANAWYLITWMPEGKVGVSNRMIYASSQSNLKQAIGADHVADTLQFETKEEILGSGSSSAESGGLNTCAPDAVDTLTSDLHNADINEKDADPNATVHTPVLSIDKPEYQVPQKMPPKPYKSSPPPPQQQRSGSGGVFVKKTDPRLAMSKWELEHMDTLKREDSARSEQLEQMRTRFGNHSIPAQPDVSPNNHHANDRGIKLTEAATTGGFHMVNLPLTQEAKATMKEFTADDNISVVELRVSSENSIEAVCAYNTQDVFTPSESEPRFYVVRSGVSRVFVHLCPENSPPRLRMVYSTANQRTIMQLKDIGCQVTHKIAVFSAKDAQIPAIAAALRSGQAQRLDTGKSVDSVVNFVPKVPAKSLPARFAQNTTKVLDGFTDEDGFRKAFSNVRPDAPAPEPFRVSSRTPSYSNTASPGSPATRISSMQSGAGHPSENDNVDESPQNGAAAWGVKLKSGQSGVSFM